MPLLTPAIAAGAMIAFALSFDDLVITSFNAGVGSSTLPLYIYSKIRFGVTPEINAVSTIIVGVTAVAILIAWRLGAFRGDDGRAVTDETGDGAGLTRRSIRAATGPAVSAPLPGPRSAPRSGATGPRGRCPPPSDPAPRRVSGPERHSAAGPCAG